MGINIDKLIGSECIKKINIPASKTFCALRGMKKSTGIDAVKNFSNAQSAIFRARLSISKNRPVIPVKKLSIITLDENLEKKDVNRAIWDLEHYIKKDLLPEQKIIKEHYSGYEIASIYTADEYVHSDKGYTDNICDCICVLLYNNDDAYLTHLWPGRHFTQESVEYMQNKIASFISALKKDGSDCRAFLFGGQKGQSEKLHRNILSVLSKKGIKPDQILFDKEKSPHRLYYDVKKGIILDGFVEKENFENWFHLVDIT